jgi:hypothetical protein
MASGTGPTRKDTTDGRVRALQLGAFVGSSKSLRPHFWPGMVLLLAGHALIFARDESGNHIRPYSDYWFAAVWFGYIFVVDALVFRRDGKSLIVTQPKVFLAMLPLSGTLWWGFEWVNKVVQNWRYERPYDIPEWWATFVSWVFFSTVVPAVWETAALVKGIKLLANQSGRPQQRIPGWLPVALIATGILSFTLPMVWPLYFFPLVWGFLFFILDPLNYLRGLPSILGALSRGAWALPLALYISGQICGILWEFWNFWAFPRWYYTIPFVGFLKVFEMPLLGYLGYGPFALEVFAFFWFVWGFVARNKVDRVGPAVLD